MTEPPSLQWTVHLARRRPRQAAAVVVVIAAGAGAAAFGFQNTLLGLLAGILLVAAVSDYLLPIQYTLGPAGIGTRGLWHRRRMKWEQVRRVRQDDLGVKLSPLRRPSRLEAYRGIYLWFADNADEVMAAITHYRAAEAAGGDDLPSV